eukprot:m51a1_g13401 putative essential myosin light chain (152) ;mRNA; f:14412-15183
MAKKETEISSDMIEEVFQVYDADHDGKVAKDSVPDIFRALGRAPTSAQVAEILKECKEFCELPDVKNVVRKFQIKTPRALEEDMTNCFRACDREGSGQVHEAELRQTLTTLGDCMKPTEVDEILKAVTVNRDGFIDYDKLVEVLIEGYPVD